MDRNRCKITTNRKTSQTDSVTTVIIVIILYYITKLTSLHLDGLQLFILGRFRELLH